MIFFEVKLYLTYQDFHSFFNLLFWGLYSLRFSYFTHYIGYSVFVHLLMTLKVGTEPKPQVRGPKKKIIMKLQININLELTTVNKYKDTKLLFPNTL